MFNHFLGKKVEWKAIECKPEMEVQALNLEYSMIIPIFLQILCIFEYGQTPFCLFFTLLFSSYFFIWKYNMFSGLANLAFLDMSCTTAFQWWDPQWGKDVQYAFIKTQYASKFEIVGQCIHHKYMKNSILWPKSKEGERSGVYRERRQIVSRWKRSWEEWDRKLRTQCSSVKMIGGLGILSFNFIMNFNLK